MFYKFQHNLKHRHGLSKHINLDVHMQAETYISCIIFILLYTGNDYYVYDSCSEWIVSWLNKKQNNLSDYKNIILNLTDTYNVTLHVYII